MAKIYIKLGDITCSDTEIVVNAAKQSLLGGGGVDGAIHYSAGKNLLEYCRKLPAIKGVRCNTGKAILTPAFNMKANNIIHTVGPVYGEHNKEESIQLLSDCYNNCLLLAQESNAGSITFPAISTGAYGYPMDEAASIAIDICLKQSSNIDIYFYLFNQHSYDIWLNELNSQTP